MKLAFDDAGDGLPVVLLHGFPLCRQMWQPQAGALVKSGCRIIAPDLPGYGESAPLGGMVTMGHYADAVIGLLDRLGIEKAVVGGMSMGGYVLLNLVERFPQRLMAALYLVTRAAADDAAGKTRRGDLAGAVRDGDREVVPEAFEKLLFAPGVAQRRPELIAQVRRWMDATSPEGVVGGLLAMRDRKDYLALLPNLTVPALVIGAAEDLAIPPIHAEALAGGLPAAELHIIPNAGHMVNLEQPEIFNKLLLGFLKSKGLI